MIYARYLSFFINIVIRKPPHGKDFRSYRANTMQERHTDRERYFRELAQTSKEFYIDYLQKFKSIGAGTRVLEIGCGEGGNLLPFAEAGCSVTGIDLAANKIEHANEYFAKRNMPGEFISGNFLNMPAWDDRFDIVLIHDVIEHIEPEDKPAFFSGIKKFLKPDGIVFFGFPAWQMPFGGHQQICRSGVCSKVPFMHLLPVSLYRGYLKIFKEDPARIDELLSIKHSKMTPEKFERLCKETGFHIVERKLWLISPHYKAKFHLRPTRLRLGLDRVPFLRNFFSTSCFYIVSAK